MAPPRGGGAAAAGTLQIFIDSATDLDTAVPGQRPYYTLELGPHAATSAAAEEGGDAHPVWNCVHAFDLPGCGGERGPLKLTVFDEGSGTHLGEALIELDRWVGLGWGGGASAVAAGAAAAGAAAALSPTPDAPPAPNPPPPHTHTPPPAPAGRARAGTTSRRPS
jgi:hypothetical protein